MKLFEIKSTVDWVWVTPDSPDVLAKAEFETPNGLKYAVFFERQDAFPKDDPQFFEKHNVQISNANPIIAIGFAFEMSAGISTGKSGTGDEHTVFAAVIQITREFVAKNSPNALYFGADSHHPSRVKVYDKLAKIFTRGGWKMHVEADSYEKSYYFVKPQ